MTNILWLHQTASETEQVNSCGAVLYQVIVLVQVMVLNQHTQMRNLSRQPRYQTSHDNNAEKFINISNVICTKPFDIEVQKKKKKVFREYKSHFQDVIYVNARSLNNLRQLGTRTPRERRPGYRGRHNVQLRISAPKVAFFFFR